MDYAKLTAQARQAAEELLQAAHLETGDIFVVGCSSSEIMGGRIGKDSSMEAAAAVLAGVLPPLQEQGVYLAAQCCEHLNRSIVIEREAAKANGYQIVSAIPQPHAGGSWATNCWQRFNDPVLVEEVRAAAGMDIGGTLIGMHLRRVAVPVRLSMDHIGQAILLCARTRSAVHRRFPRRLQSGGSAMIPEAQKQQMAEAVAKIRETMAAAAKAAGRDPAEVRLCAACKTRTVEEVRYSADLPIDLFGENHVQELVEKTDANAYNGKPGHFIGHLQTNKVNKVVGRAALIQSVDSTRLLDKIDAAAARLGLVQDILVEINIGEEASKSGVDADSLFPLLEAAAAREHIRLRGLMAIPPADADDTETRRFFAQMRELLARADAQHYDRAQMDILSMGMSHDYAAAIAEGATIVRVGTAIYGARDYSKKA